MLGHYDLAFGINICSWIWIILFHKHDDNITKRKKRKKRMLMCLKASAHNSTTFYKMIKSHVSGCWFSFLISGLGVCMAGRGTYT